MRCFSCSYCNRRMYMALVAFAYSRLTMRMEKLYSLTLSAQQLATHALGCSRAREGEVSARGPGDEDDASLQGRSAGTSVQGRRGEPLPGPRVAGDPSGQRERRVRVRHAGPDVFPLP